MTRFFVSQLLLEVTNLSLDEVDRPVRVRPTW